MLLSPTLGDCSWGQCGGPGASPGRRGRCASDGKGTTGSQGQWLGVLGVGGGPGDFPKGVEAPRRSCCHLLCHAHLRSPRGGRVPHAKAAFRTDGASLGVRTGVAISCPPEPSPPWGGRPGWGSWVVLGTVPAPHRGGPRSTELTSQWVPQLPLGGGAGSLLLTKHHLSL